MKVLSAEEIRQWDQFTIENEPISSLDLMERAATKCTEWITENYRGIETVSVFCGKGNNGGDGLVIARQLAGQNIPVSVCILEFGHKGTDDFQANLARLHQYNNVDIFFIQSAGHFRQLLKETLVIDALFGTGLSRPLEGVTKDLVEYINRSGCEIISIDIPSGLFTDQSAKDAPAIHATHTLTFQCYKPAFLFAENENVSGTVHLLEIGLHNGFLSTVNNRFELTDDNLIASIYKPRKQFSHKGRFGHAFLIAGGYGKIGAAVLAAKACLRSGAGLLTCHVPKCGYEIMQAAVPEAMVTADFNSSFVTKTGTDYRRYNSIGTGPGIGTAYETRQFLRELLENADKPIVLDADALNIIAEEKSLLTKIPQNSVLTPHPKEFERLFGETTNDFENASLALAKAKELHCIIVLKGHFTFIALPTGHGYFNATGNAGMATAGSGDVLTGILTGLLAQGYTPESTAILGVYMHGLAGDFAADEYSQEAMIAGDIILAVARAYIHINQSA
ncbi:MAG: NAD(P)H-hydrate dehydratase [Chitinophagaceae bacterium]|nr:NAD(P)H-hydrate dehydratase [Chitinophagaceae bacterium]